MSNQCPNPCREAGHCQACRQEDEEASSDPGDSRDRTWGTEGLDGPDPWSAALSRSKGSRASGSGPRALVMGTAPSRDSDRVRAKLPAVKGSGSPLVPVICGPAFPTRDGEQPQLPRAGRLRSGHSPGARRSGCLRGGGPGYRTGPRTRAAPGCISSGTISPRCVHARHLRASHARRSRGVAAAGRGDLRGGPPLGTGRPSDGPAWRGSPLRARSRRSDNSRTLPVITWAGT